MLSPRNLITWRGAPEILSLLKVQPHLAKSSDALLPCWISSCMVAAGKKKSGEHSIVKNSVVKNYEECGGLVGRILYPY